MSFDFNYKFWVGTKKDIERLIKQQNVLKEQSPVKSPLITYRIFSEMYILYAELVNKLGYVYSRTFQVQKREVVRKLVESATRRLLELKNELKDLELSEYIYTDERLIARKLTPHDLVIWRSPNFLYRRPPEMENIIYDNKIFMNEEQKEEVKVKESFKRRDAVILIQRHERARSARVYKAAIKYDTRNLKNPVQKTLRHYSFTHKSNQVMSIPVKRTIFNINFVKADQRCRNLLEADNLKSNSANDLEILETTRIRNEAALRIQIAWRAHKNKKIFKMQNNFKQTLFGMKPKRRLRRPNQYMDSLIETYKNEQVKQKLNEDFLKLIADERIRLLQEKSPWIMEDISDQIRHWFREFYDKVEDFHPYPDAIKEGTVLVVIEETMTPLEFSDAKKLKSQSKEEKKKRAEKLKLEKQKQKEKLKKEKLKEANLRKKMKASGVIDLADDLKRNKNVEIIEQTMKSYSNDWKLIDEYLNKNHEPIKEWVTEQELAKIHKELRMLVDEFMRLEYELLRRALAKDLKKKYKPQKQKQFKNKKDKNGKTLKDVTEDRTLVSLYDELKDAGIIEKYSNDKSLDQFIAEYNFVADDTRDENHLSTIGPAKGDIKMVVQECMLGMHVDKPKSLLLIGPYNNGKKLLCSIIASELDAVFMNLSPEKTSQFSDNLNYFLHVVMKVAKAFQPTIIFIEDAHKVFWKKIPKDTPDDLNPRLLQKSLINKMLKPIKRDDKIMIVGTSDEPWAAKPILKRAFHKILLVPRSDYGTSFLLWHELLSHYAGDDNVEEYAVSALAKTLQHYNTGDVHDNIKATLNIRRKMRLKSTPLNPNEFVTRFLEGGAVPIFPPDPKIMEKYDKWFGKANKYSIMRRKYQAIQDLKNKTK